VKIRISFHLDKSEGPRFRELIVCRLENNAKTDLKQTRCENVYWINLAQDRAINLLLL
jgi:hypothetical protein